MPTPSCLLCGRALPQPQPTYCDALCASAARQLQAPVSPALLMPLDVVQTLRQVLAGEPVDSAARTRFYAWLRQPVT